MSSQHRYFCDICNKELDHSNEGLEGMSSNVAWPKGNFNIHIQIGDMCKKCAASIARSNLSGRLLEEVLKKNTQGRPIPLP